MGKLEAAGNALKKIMRDEILLETSVTRTPVTMSINSLGDETSTEGTSHSISVYIVRKNAPWTFDKSGEIAGGDALMLVRNIDTVNKNDKITWQGKNYRVQDILARDQLASITVYFACNLFYIGDS